MENINIKYPAFGPSQIKLRKCIFADVTCSWFNAPKIDGERE
jgi:hypothetical protein